MVSCGVSGFECGLTGSALTAITISNYAGDVLGDGFVGASGFSLLGAGYICVFYGRLVHEFLTDGDGYVFKMIGIGKDP